MFTRDSLLDVIVFDRTRWTDCVNITITLINLNIEDENYEYIQIVVCQVMMRGSFISSSSAIEVYSERLFLTTILKASASRLLTLSSNTLKIGCRKQIAYLSLRQPTSKYIEIISKPSVSTMVSSQAIIAFTCFQERQNTRIGIQAENHELAKILKIGLQ